MVLMDVMFSNNTRYVTVSRIFNFCPKIEFLVRSDGGIQVEAIYEEKMVKINFSCPTETIL